MSVVLLDTTVASLLHPRKRNDVLRSKYEPHMHGRTVAMSFQTVAELWGWAESNQWGGKARERLDVLIRRFLVIPYDYELARTWAWAMACSRRDGRELETGDCWIIATAVDTAIVLAQAAMEVLAWTCCVRDRRMISAKAFGPRGLSADDRLRLLGSILGIPLPIPQFLTSLCNRPGKKWKDAMEVLTDTRNRIVHPQEDEALSMEGIVEVWKLALWYIELILLRLCGHNGEYVNRLTAQWVGVVERVPWATEDE